MESNEEECKAEEISSRRKTHCLVAKEPTIPPLAMVVSKPSPEARKHLDEPNKTALEEALKRDKKKDLALPAEKDI